MTKENSIPSLDKVFDLLEVFETSDFAPMTIKQIMEKSGLKRNSSDRLLNYLESRGYVVQNEQKKWILGTKLLRFSEKYAQFCLNVIAKK